LQALRFTLTALVALVLIPAAVMTVLSGLPLALLQMALGLEVSVP
jgi:hypothetical protein